MSKNIKGLMMTPFDVRDEFQRAFGFPVEQATPDQVEFILDCARHVRRRCPNNGELSTWANECFPSIHTAVVEVQDKVVPERRFKCFKVFKKIQQGLKTLANLY